MIEIKPHVTYSGRRWKGDRKVVEIVRHRGQEPIVHYVDTRTHRTGNAPLAQFTAGVLKIAEVGGKP